MVQAILDTPLFAEIQSDRISWMMERTGGILLKLVINWLWWSCYTLIRIRSMLKENVIESGR
jgi:hypothetical protein